MKPLIDKILAFTISRKLTVFLIGTFGLYSEHITATDWINLSIMYIGTQGVIDLWVQIKNK